MLRLRDHIAHLERLAEDENHSPILADPDPLFDELVARARNDGLRLGDVLLLDRPLRSTSAGQYRSATGDIWVFAQSDREETLRVLLHELAHAERNADGRLAAYDSLEGYWEEEVATWQRAAELADCWDVGDLLDENALARKLEHVERGREHTEQAARLAGSRHPFVAGAAHDALVALAVECGWSADRLETILFGGGSTKDRQAALTFDRARCRTAWQLGVESEGGFGAAAVEADAWETHLAGALRHSAHAAPLATPDREIIWSDTPVDLYTVDLVRLGSTGLPVAISTLTQVLLLQHRNRALAARVSVAELGEARIYHLTASWESGGDSVGPEAHVLLLAADHPGPRQQQEEAALQQYLTSFGDAVAIRPSQTPRELSTLWGLLAAGGDEEELGVTQPGLF